MEGRDELRLFQPLGHFSVSVVPDAVVQFENGGAPLRGRPTLERHLGQLLVLVLVFALGLLEDARQHVDVLEELVAQLDAVGTKPENADGERKHGSKRGRGSDVPLFHGRQARFDVSGGVAEGADETVTSGELVRRLDEFVVESEHGLATHLEKSQFLKDKKNLFPRPRRLGTGVARTVRAFKKRTLYYLITRLQGRDGLGEAADGDVVRALFEKVVGHEDELYAVRIFL